MSERYLLDGLRVVELATFVFAPAAGTVLADFGADVVHIEHPRIGDAYRYLPQSVAYLPPPDENYCWILTARGKQSIALDLQCDAGRAVARDLVRRADVFITNLHPSVLAKLGMRWEDLAPENPRLIYAHATGYGDAGAEVEAGLRRHRLVGALEASWTRCAPVAPSSGSRPRGYGRPPERHDARRCDALALYDRERTGKSRRVRSSLLANGA
jgi:formyl-CoA transferase